MIKDKSKYTELQLVMEAGRILMESGAEVYRIEETMKWMAQSLGIRDFHGYVMNLGLTASGIMPDGELETRVMTTNEINIDLQKIDCINSLSRSLKEEGSSLSQLRKQLQNIDQLGDFPAWMVSLAYFLGAGGFALALGSLWLDALISALSALLMGMMMGWTGRLVTTTYLKTLLSSSLLTLIVTLFYTAGFGSSRGIILLGALMLLVPGVTFVTSIRELSQGNTVIGSSQFMYALISASSISVGVAVLLAVLPFADQLSNAFPLTEYSFTKVLVQALAAAVGTVAFSVLYRVPVRYYKEIGLLGGGAWLLYLLLVHGGFWEGGAVFLAALLVSLVSQWLAVRKKCPASIFLLTSMFPLVPGLSFYRFVYFLLIGQGAVGQEYLRSAMIAAIAIALAIALVKPSFARKYLFKQSCLN